MPSGCTDDNDKVFAFNDGDVVCVSGVRGSNGSGGGGRGEGGGWEEVGTNPELEGEDACRGTFVAPISFFIGEGEGKVTNEIAAADEGGRGGGWWTYDGLE